MPDPIDRLALALLPILFGTRQAPPSGRLRPLLAGLSDVNQVDRLRQSG